MPKIKTKEEALNTLQKLDEKVLVRMAELSSNEKAIGYFKSAIQFKAVKLFLST